MRQRAAGSKSGQTNSVVKPGNVFPQQRLSSDVFPTHVNSVTKTDQECLDTNSAVETAKVPFSLFFFVGAGCAWGGGHNFGSLVDFFKIYKKSLAS